MNLARLLLAPIVVRRGKFKRFKKIASSENENNIQEDVDEKIRYFPDEVIIHILNYCDARSILNCSKASSHFNELAVQIESISVQIPYAIGIWEHRVPVWPQGLKNSLRQFSRIRSAKVEFSFGVPNPNPESIIRWKWVPQGSIYLFAQRIVPFSDDQGECSVVDPDDATIGDLARSVAFVLDRQPDLDIWKRYTEEIVTIFPNLEELTIVDSRRQGRMIVDGAAVDFLTGNLPRQNVVNQLKTWIAHHVKIPSTGYAMEDVIVHVSRLNEVSDELIAQNICEEREYCQAIVRMMAEAPTRSLSRVAPNF